MSVSRHIARRIAAVALVLAVVPEPAAANLFAPGEIKAVESLGVPGGVVADPLRPFMIDLGGGLSISGNVQDRVIDYGGGLLAFGTYIREITGSAGSVIESYGRNGFFDALNVTWSPTSIGTIPPSLGLRSADGGTMSFFYSPGIPLSPGGVFGGNAFTIIRTDATEFAAVGEIFIGARAATGQFGSTTLTVFAPVPEPGAYALLVAGLALIGLIGWRRGPALRAGAAR